MLYILMKRSLFRNFNVFKTYFVKKRRLTALKLPSK